MGAGGPERGLRPALWGLATALTEVLLLVVPFPETQLGPAGFMCVHVISNQGVMDLDCVSSAQELKKAQNTGAVVSTGWTCVSQSSSLCGVSTCAAFPRVRRFHVCGVSTCAAFPRVWCFHVWCFHVCGVSTVGTAAGGLKDHPSQDEGVCPPL